MLHWRVNGAEQTNKEEETQGTGESTLCSLIDHTTMKPGGRVKVVGGPTEPHQTLHIMSDGMFLYWLYALKLQETVPHPVTGEKVKQYPVFLQTLEVKVSGCVIPL